MPRYREQLPQLGGGFYLTDGGLETTLVFNDGIDLPGFAAFVLLDDEDGRDRLRRYYRSYLDIAWKKGAGFIFESVTWRASRDWGERLGYTTEQIEDFNLRSIELLQELRSEYEGRLPHMVLSGCMGPRGDGYVADTAMTVEEAQAYHRNQVACFSDSKADMVSAFTMTNVAEAIGIVRAAVIEKIPVVVSFTVETDSRLPSGEPLGSAIEQVDAATDNAPAYYMINCAHPEHFRDALGPNPWTRRIRGVRANASTRSHAELDECTELDEGDPQDLGERYRDLLARLENLNVFGGCCGTDERHINEIVEAVGTRFR